MLAAPPCRNFRQLGDAHVGRSPPAQLFIATDIGERLPSWSRTMKYASVSSATQGGGSGAIRDHVPPVHRKAASRIAKAPGMTQSNTNSKA